MTNLQLTIPETSLATAPGKPYTLYHILLRLPLRSLIVKRRYNDFIELHARLTQLVGLPPPKTPPGKSYFTRTVNNPVLTEQRRQALEAYLREILENSDARWRNTPAWRTFLELPSSWANGTPIANGGFSMGANTPVTDPTMWLDSHRELKGLLHEARIFLQKRDNAMVAGEQYEASAGAKRCLVKASGLISALDSGLRESTGGRNHNGWNGNGNSAEGGLLEGEVRRRRDLIAAARKERDGLESLANSLASKRPDQNVSAPMLADKTALFGAAARNHVGTGRVLGGPLLETERTSKLNNQELLQLQEEVMRNQNEEVEVLLESVTRQKNMGYAINEELEAQIKMLKGLGDDAARVDGKMKVAQNRMNKIS
ncbi:hypothetical protein RUND412_009474 [Rhizina undulata]